MEFRIHLIMFLHFPASFHKKTFTFQSGKSISHVIQPNKSFATGSPGVFSIGVAVILYHTHVRNEMKK